MELWELTATDLRASYEKRAVSPTEVVDALLARIDRLDPDIGAFRQVIAEEATAEAKTQTEELANQRTRGPLHGVPIAIKELFDVAGTSGCYGSMILEHRISPEDAAAVTRLRDAGAIVVGTTRSHEFGWGITNQNESLGSTYNPWDPSRVPGGSSGGSAAAVAVGMVPLALGSDTGGSIRIPSCFCGVTGLKPSYGRVSKRGAVALAPSLDHPGPIARSLDDVALGLNAMSGLDPDDPTTIAASPPSSGVLPSLDGVRVGVCPDLHITPLRGDHRERFESAIAAVTESGGVIVEVALSDAEAIRPTFASIQMAEAFHNHSVTLGMFPERAEDYGQDVRKRLEMAAEVGVAEYISAKQGALQIRRDFQHLFEDVDVLLTPVTAGGPSRVDAPDRSPYEDDSLPFRDLVMDYTVPQDLTGLPAVSIPNGLDADRLPVGAQLTTWAEEEEKLISAAAALSAAISSGPTWPGMAMS